MMRPPLLLVLLGLSACSGVETVTGYLTPYKVDVRQGNFVTQEMVSQLKPGLTRDQVRFILGSPLVADMFHENRWDYIYRFKEGRGAESQRRLAVFFEDDKLARVTGDVIAEQAATPGAATPAPAAPPAK
jgi:outer membrane protein assembly factor BamE